MLSTYFAGRDSFSISDSENCGADIKNVYMTKRVDTRSNIF